MEYLYVMFGACIVLAVVGGTMSSQAIDEPCPEHCVCNLKQVNCSNIVNAQWVDFLQRVPKDAQILVIKNSSFLNMALPETAAIPNLKNMKYLRITNCNITVIGSRAFRAFTDLIELHLDSDSIRELDVEALHSLSSLRLLSLKQNVINALHEKTFQETPQLQVLDLAYNHIEILYPTTFHPTEELQMLNLTKNKLTYLHPYMFKNLSKLHSVDLDHNQLEVLHQDTFQNLTSLRHLSVGNNRWACDCGLQWLHSANNETHPLLRSLKTKLRCQTPLEHQSAILANLSGDNLTCTSPTIRNSLTDAMFLRLETKVLKCNATGYPTPSVYWITPRGVLAVAQNQRWMSPEIVRFKATHEYIGIPRLHDSKLVALEDGSLEIHKIRHYFTGRYTCVAENPAGVSVTSFNVTMRTVIPGNVHFSMLIGGIIASCFFVLCAIFAAIRQSVFFTLKRKYKKAVADIEGAQEVREDSSPGSDQDDWYPDHWSRNYASPYESPMKCTTPIEPYPENEQQGRLRIRETLEDARYRLRAGMERSVTKIRSGAQHVKESSTYYMQTIKESGSTTIHHLRSSGSQYANRMRAGMVLGVEQVKYHVQSMRELCLTGSIGQTISTVSVATDVDSHQQTDVVKKVTYV